MGGSWAVNEMAGAAVWDGRCRRSLGRICDQLVEQPEVSFSAACGANLRHAAHRIFEHPTTSVSGLLAGHREQTAARCADHELVLAIQDSTEYNFSGLKQATGLGPLGQGLTRGLMGHAALAATPAGVPLGILHLNIWVRDPAELGKRSDCRKKATADKESQKWLDGLTGIEAALPADRRVLVIADREADVFAYLAAPRRANTDLLIRACQARIVAVVRPGVAGEVVRIDLLTAATQAPVVGETTVTIPRKPGQPEREATLQLQLTEADVQPPRHRRAGEPNTPVSVRIIRAQEVAPPPGVAAVEWLLVTTLAVATAAEAAQVVQYYACRWVIERWHYTLKQGCQVEKLQIDDATSLQHALAVYGVVAWRLLWLTLLARTEPERPAASVLGTEELAVLTQASGKPVATVRQAVRAIAKLGGFAGSPSEGEPGVKSLWLGIRRLGAMTEGWRLAFAAFQDMIHG